MTLAEKTKSYTRLIDKQAALYEYYAKKFGLQSKCLYILMWLYYTPEGISQKKICEKTYSSKQVVHATIKMLKKEGYIQFKEVDYDKRHKLVQLTVAGKHYAQGILQPLAQMEQCAFATLTKDEQTLFIALMSKYSQALMDLMEEKNGHD